MRDFKYLRLLSENEPVWAVFDAETGDQLSEAMTLSEARSWKAEYLASPDYEGAIAIRSVS